MNNIEIDIARNRAKSRPCVISIRSFSNSRALARLDESMTALRDVINTLSRSSRARVTQPPFLKFSAAYILHAHW